MLATYAPHAAHTLLNCTTPSDALGIGRPTGIDMLRITLNGQQFSQPLRYDVLPPPVTRDIYPLTAPERGGIVVTIHGEGFDIDRSASNGSANTTGASSADEAGSGESGSGVATSALPTFAPHLLRCKFGVATVEATLLNRSAVTCVVPTAEASGVSASKVIRFEDSMFEEWVDYYGRRAIMFDDPSFVLLGDTVIRDNTLKLTRSIPEQAGGFLFTAPALAGQALEAVRSLTLCPTDPDARVACQAASGAPATFPTAFRLSFRLTMGTGFFEEGPIAERLGGEGFSLSIGDLPYAPAGEHGNGNGLRVSLRTRANVMSVEYADRLLHSGPLPEAERLRSNASFPVVLALRNDSLSLNISETAVLVDEPLPEWRDDARSTWRFGFSARTNPTRGENHWVQDVHLQLGPFLDPVTVNVSVTSNGQQYAPSSEHVQLRYFGAPDLFDLI